MRICRGCKITEDKAEFKPNANLCMPCHKEYMKQYRQIHREKIRKQVQGWKDNNRDRHRENNRNRYATEEGKILHKDRVERTFRSWLSLKIGALRSHAKNPTPHDPKDGPRRDFDIDIDYVMSILEEQKERCAITNIPLMHRYNDGCAASIDRIDSSKGHVKNNIQIVCQWVNRAKNNMTNDEFIEILNMYVKEITYTEVRGII